MQASFETLLTTHVLSGICNLKDDERRSGVSLFAGQFGPDGTLDKQYSGLLKRAIHLPDDKLLLFSSSNPASLIRFDARGVLDPTVTRRNSDDRRLLPSGRVQAGLSPDVFHF